MAWLLGYYTAYVNTESVSRYKIIKNNESCKTDLKDPWVILLVGKVGKLIRHRLLQELYDLLRNYNRMHDQENEQKIYIKIQLTVEIKNLYSDFFFKNSLPYGTSGRILIEDFHCNPYWITKYGYTKFCKVMKKKDKINIRCICLKYSSFKIQQGHKG